MSELAFDREWSLAELLEPAILERIGPLLAQLLGGALVLHLLNANSFFGFTKANPTGTPRRYAALALGGFAAAIAWFTLAWG